MLNRWLRTTTRVISLIVAGLIISACGGGGGTGSGGFLGNEGADQLDAVIAIAATNAAGDPDNQLSRSNPLTIEVTLERANGDPITNAVVELGASVGTVSPDNGSALTDANGVALFEVTFDGTEGAGTLTATYTEAAQSVEVALSIQATAGAPAYLLESGNHRLLRYCDPALFQHRPANRNRHALQRRRDDEEPCDGRNHSAGELDWHRRPLQRLFTH